MSDRGLTTGSCGFDTTPYRAFRSSVRIVLHTTPTVTSIPVGVAYNSDVQLVTATLLAAADDVENVLKDPAPQVQFLKFGDYSLDFRLLVWSALPRRHTQIRSDINYRIEKLFRERSIEIPYPTQEYLMRGSLPAEEPTLLADNQPPIPRRPREE